MSRAFLLACLLVLMALASGCATPEEEANGGADTPPVRPPADDQDDAGNDGDADGQPDAGSGNGTDEQADDPPAPPEERMPPLEVPLALETVVDGLTKPVGFLQADDGSGRSYIVEQEGRVRVMEPDGSLREEPFLDLRGQVSTGFEQGLLAIAFPPVPDGRVFVSYTDEDGRSILERYRIEPGESPRVDEASARVLLTVDQPFPNHNGGLILFGPDGHLWYALGDGGDAGDPKENGQDPETLLGSLLRLDVRGDEGYQIPSDNPFVDGNGRDEIYHYGLRNPWRFSFDRETSALYVADVGQAEVEEVNVVPLGEAGLNFGWNIWEGSERYRGGTAEGDVVFPVAEYTHEETGGCSVTGGHVYRGSAIPDLRGVYLYGDYCSGDVWGLVQEEGEWRTRRMLETDHKITSFGQDLEGELYVVDHGGSIHRVVRG